MRLVILMAMVVQLHQDSNHLSEAALQAGDLVVEDPQAAEATQEVGIQMEMVMALRLEETEEVLTEDLLRQGLRTIQTIRTESGAAHINPRAAEACRSHPGHGVGNQFTN